MWWGRSHLSSSLLETTSSIMASPCIALFIQVLLCISYARTEDLHLLLNSTEHTIGDAKTHVEHMFSLNPLPNQEKIPPLVKNESEHLAHETKKLATQLHEVIATGEHKPEIKDAVNTAVTHLNEAAATLEHTGTDLKQDNTHYFGAADKVLHEIRNIIDAGPCEKVSPILKASLDELTHDVNNYQHGIHGMVGPHEGYQGAGHVHADAGHHNVHHHHAGSSEESSEESSSHKHAHHH